jgi:hypothetical protein
MKTHHHGEEVEDVDDPSPPPAPLVKFQWSNKTAFLLSLIVALLTFGLTTYTNKIVEDAQQNYRITNLEEQIRTVKEIQDVNTAARIATTATLNQIQENQRTIIETLREHDNRWAGKH